MEQSESIERLAAALVAAQGEFPPIAKTKVAHVGHYSYQYADLADLVETMRPILRKHGLAVTQTLGGTTVLSDGIAQVYVTTRLMHESGEWLQSTSSLVANSISPQAIGAVITYARRYAYQAILGIAAEEDTDAQAEAAPAKPTVVKIDGHRATEPQRKKIFALARKLGWTDEAIKAFIREHYEVDSTSDLTVTQASDFITYLEAQEDGPPF